MPGKNPVIFRQRRKPLQGFLNGSPTAAGQISSAAGTGKQRITGNKYILAEQANRAGSVSWRVQYMDSQTGERQGVALVVSMSIVANYGNVNCKINFNEK